MTPSSQTLRRITRWAVRGSAALFATQIALATALTAADTVRKYRRPSTGEFPQTAPRDIDVLGTSMRVHSYGANLYDDMLEAINNAEHTIFFETYIWKSDQVGTRFKEALIRAAQRGVDVFIIYDVFGNLVVKQSFYHFPQMPNLHVLRFPLIRPGLLIGNFRRTGRDHRKIVVVDNDIGFVGGYNIGDLYATTWRDTHVRLEGPSTWELSNAFVDFWNDHRKSSHPALDDKGAKHWFAQVQAAVNQPQRLLFPVRGMYIDALDRALDHIYISSAYFIPDKDIRHALKVAASRGVDVRVLLPHNSNHVLADWVSRPHFHELLEAGVKIYAFQEAMIHSKTMTVDNRWTTIGTANIDRLSLLGNFEINLEIHHEELATYMEEMFQIDLSNAKQINLAQWETRGRHRILVEQVLKPLGFLL